MDLFTIGYEKAALSDVLGALKAAGVRVLIDVRDRPQSRRAGFSKRQLSAAADAEGIRYVHMKPLGTPPEGRAAHRCRDLDTFWRIVDDRMATPEAKAALDQAAILAAEQTSCLICYEADWRVCHRRRVAEAMERRGFISRHLAAITTFL